MTAARPVQRAIDWGELAPLRLRAREAAEGIYAGVHRSLRRGAGVEFGGYREYVPGDDLRWLDRRSLLRHDRLVVRQFETETDRALWLVVDASASMAFRGPRSPAAKLAFAGVVAAALARVGLASGDPVALTYFGGARAGPVGRSSGREQFERVVGSLEAVIADGDARADTVMLERCLQSVARGTPRGAIIVVLSDFIDLPDGAPERVAALACGGRALVAVQTLDRAEVDFPYTGSVRLKSLEGGSVVETDAETARDGYRAALSALAEQWRRAIVLRGGRFVRATTDERPVDVVRRVIEALR